MNECSVIYLIVTLYSTSVSVSSRTPKTTNKKYTRLSRTVEDGGHGDGGVHGVGPALQQLQPRLRRLDACMNIVVGGEYWNKFKV